MYIYYDMIMTVTTFVFIHVVRSQRQTYGITWDINIIFHSKALGTNKVMRRVSCH